ncbi:MAG: hypothetical protein JWL79_3099 [Frankiales bacterium]|nr:hypothetical protein [Frankiales bacterium]
MPTLEYAREKFWTASVGLIGDDLRDRLLEVTASGLEAGFGTIAGIESDVQERLDTLRHNLAGTDGLQVTIGLASNEQVTDWAKEVINLALLLSQAVGEAEARR